jgi:hypothetical protein
MPNHLPNQIIDRITELISDQSSPKAERDRLLKSVAEDAWYALFPEDTVSFSASIPSETRRKRWAELQAQLAGNPSADKIIRVITSCASGEQFYWV